MLRDTTFFVGVGGEAAGSFDNAVRARVEAAARSAGGRLLTTSKAQDALLFAFSGASAALRFAQVAGTAEHPAMAALPGTGMAVRSDRRGNGHGSDTAPELAIALAALAPPGHLLVCGAMRKHLDQSHDTALVELTPVRIGGHAPIRVFQLSAADLDRTQHVIRIGAFTLDTSRFELRCNGAPVAVEPRTFDLLVLLARNVGRTVTREELFRRLWGERIVSDAALSSQIKAARRVLGDDGHRQQIIATVHGRGFRLRASVQAPVRTPAGGLLVASTATDADPTDCAAPPVRRPGLLVQPFTNLDEDGRGAVIAGGLTEDLINALTRTRWLGVTAGNPARQHSGSDTNLSGAAAMPTADYLLTGSLRRVGNRVRITAQATDCRSMRCLWSESFDRETHDILELQQEIASLVAARFATELGISEQRKAARTPPANLGAWELYQLGSAEFYRFTPESNLRCRNLMRQAIRLDPGFGQPHARLAYAIILEMVYFEGPVDRHRLDEALALAEAAVACDDQDSNALFTLGRVRLARQEYQLAIDALEHAIELNPCHALAWCGMGDSLAYEGRLDEALRSFDRAIKLGPHDPFRWAFMSYRALAHLFAGQFEDAVTWARQAAQVPNAHYWSRANLISALGHLGKSRESRDNAAQLFAERPGFSRSFARKRLFYLRKAEQMNVFLDGLRMAGIP